MKTVRTQRHQEGAITMFITVVILLLLTAMVGTSYQMSQVNTTAVWNSQSRQAAVAAAKLEIEKVVDSPFTTDPTAVASAAIPVDLNNDAVADFSVAMSAPVCERSSRADTPSTSSVQLPGFSPGGAFNTIWRIQAVASDGVSGAEVTVTHRVRVLLDKVDQEAVCA
jgi:zona occludens toxin (predicted ATPase)